MAMREEFIKYLYDVRGIDTPCERCGGAGVRTYSSTAVWRGGIGGQALTQGVCDLCWGSGDVHRPWTNLRELDQKLNELQRRRDKPHHFCGCQRDAIDM